MDDRKLLDWIEKVGDVNISRCRVGSPTGPLRWDVEVGPLGPTRSASTLREALEKAMRVPV